MIRYICKNKDQHISDRDWICFCPENYLNKLSAKQILKTACNSWLSENDIRSARKFAEDPLTTEEDALLMIAKLEDHANGAYEMWRNCQ